MSMIQLLGDFYTLSKRVNIHLIDDNTISQDILFRDFKEEAKTRVWIQRRRNNYILFDRLRNRGVGTNEIEELAARITKTSKKRDKRERSKWHKQEVRRILSMRIETMRRDIEKLQRKQKSLLMKRSKHLKKQFIITKEYTQLLKTFIENDWKHQVDKCNKKIKHLVSKYGHQKVKEPAIEELKKAVKIKDIDFQQKSKDIQNYVVYGDIPLTKAEIRYIQLPPDHRLLDKITKDRVENQAEKIATKLRYDNMNSINLPNRDDGITWNGDRVLDFQELKVTEFKTNGRIYAPKLGNKDQELLIERMKDKYIETCSKYINIDDKDRKPENVTEEEWSGMRSLQRRVKDREIVITTTDKTKKTAVISMEIYTEMAKSHTDKDTKVTLKVVKKIEREANYHSKVLTAVLNIGTGLKDKERWETAKKVVDSKSPITEFHPKDHKEIPQGDIFPPSRGVCNATEGPLTRVEYTSTLWFDKVAENQKSKNECINTEMLKREFYEVNKIPVPEGTERIVISMDIVSLYPSLQVDTVKKEMFKVIEQSNVEIRNINWRLLTIYIDRHVDPEMIKKKGLKPLMPTKNTKPKSPLDEEAYTWKDDIEPSEIQMRRMLAFLALEIVDFIMNNHTYTVGEDIFLQSEGAPIGMDFARVISRIIMNVFDEKLGEQIRLRASEMDLLMHMSYVDDKNVVLDVQIKDNDTKAEIETKTANILKEIADQIFPGMLTVTVDYPSNHTNNKMPMLDLEVWVDSQGIIKHNFYMKETAYKGLVRVDSGLSGTSIRNILFSEGMRRLSNCSPEMEWKDKVIYLDQLNMFMKEGNHRENFRSTLTENIIRNYVKILNSHNEGSRLIYRSKEEMILMKKKKSNKTSWFKEKGFDFNFQIPGTKNNILKSDIKKELEQISGKKILISEEVGMKNIMNVKKSNPSCKERCSRTDCKPCLHGMKEEKCYRNNIGYRIICNRSPCSDNINTDLRSLDTDNFRKQLDAIKEGDHRPAAYEGESYRSSFTRSKGHWSKYNTASGQSASFMFFHTKEHHSGVIGINKGEHDYKFILTGTFRSNIDRLVDEGRRQTIMERYQAEKKLIVLNSKIDFVQPMRTQLTVINKPINRLPGQPDLATQGVRLYTTPQTTTTTTTTKPVRKTMTARRKNLPKVSHNFQPKLTSTPDKLPTIDAFKTDLSPVKWKVHIINDVLVHNITDSDITEWSQTLTQPNLTRKTTPNCAGADDGLLQYIVDENNCSTID